MLTKKILAISCAIMFLSGVVNATELYKWTDENGVTHYGDESNAIKEHNAQQITVKAPGKLGNVSPTSSNSSEYVPARRNISNQNGTAVSNYSISIVSPSPNEEIRANNGVITVSTNITPMPSSPYSIKVFVDGSLSGSADNSNTAQVQAVPRGEHDITVKLQTNGKIFASNSVHVTVLRVALGGK